jgi:hypothetical protein
MIIHESRDKISVRKNRGRITKGPALKQSLLNMLYTVLNLLGVALTALGRAVVSLVAVETDSVALIFAVNSDFGRGPFVALAALKLARVSFVIKGDSTFLAAVVSNGVSSERNSSSERDQHQSDNNFFHC